MRKHKIAITLFGTFCIAAICWLTARSQAAKTVQVHMVITDAAFRTEKSLPALNAENVKVKQGKGFLSVAQVIPAQGEAANLQLIILIDDTLNTQAVGNNLTDLKAFIGAQPPTTVIAVAYMSNAIANVAQNFTADHALAVKAVRLPRGTPSTMDSPYLSLINLVKGWPKENVRREVLMITDGIDRLRDQRPGPDRLGPRFDGMGPIYHAMPTISIDATSASEISQRYNVIVHSIYSPGIGGSERGSWTAQMGLSGLSKLADETGGECYSLGTSNAVSFKPYLESLQKVFMSQYFLVFRAVPKKKGSLQSVKVEAQPKTKILAPNNVWVPGVVEDE
ncbi:MAG: hypothetical protein WA510_14500 [Acidobacteriaceae bacterium]